MSMLDMRRRMMMAGGGLPALPTYTGTYNLVGDTTQGYIELLTNGTLTLAEYLYDVCLVGGGAGGGKSYGGYGGYSHSYSGLSLAGDFAAAIGTGGATSTSSEHGSNGTASTLGGTYTSAGGTRAAGGEQGNMSVASTAGADGAYPWGDAAFSNYGGGGGGGEFWNGTVGRTAKAGGLVGGGYGGASGKVVKGTDNTGGGGGSQGYHSVNGYTAPGKGGTGIIVVRWGY